MSTCDSSRGATCKAALASGPLAPARAVHIIDQVAKALHAAHRVGLIHRDIKPSNILLDADDFAYLIDFGIARATDETRMTKSGHMIGTFAYIAPERLDHTKEEDARADVYALACVLYEALTGQPPFVGTTTAHLIAAHLNAPPPRASTTQPGVPPAVDAVIATGMAKNPEHRYATTIQLANAARGAITAPAYLPPLPPTVQAPLPATRQATLPRPARNVGAADQPQGLRAALEPTPVPHTAEDKVKQRRANAITFAVIVMVLLMVLALIVGVIVMHPRLYRKASAARSVVLELDRVHDAVEDLLRDVGAAGNVVDDQPLVAQDVVVKLVVVVGEGLRVID
jgi:serine/threonine protein kinase